jgi:hypothetical protein
MEAYCVAKDITIGSGLKAAAKAKPAPTTPAEIYAHYRTLKGDDRSAYYQSHSNIIWDHYCSISKTW